MKAGDYEREEREGNRIYMTGKLTERNLSGEKRAPAKQEEGVRRWAVCE